VNSIIILSDKKHIKFDSCITPTWVKDVAITGMLSRLTGLYEVD
jgi:hypothetical protein